MPVIYTAAELGLAVRSRRKTLGWDQARLAGELGVSRQWVIDIEKGKPRAELGLALQALRVLGLRLDAVAAETGAEPDDSGQGALAGIGVPHIDLDRIVERHRGNHPDWQGLPADDRQSKGRASRPRVRGSDSGRGKA